MPSKPPANAKALYPIGLAQQIRAAQMEVYFSCRHLDENVRGFESTGAIVEAPLDDIDLFMAGSQIRDGL